MILPRTTSWLPASLLLASAVFAAALVGCGEREGDETPPADTSSERTPTETYEVRGQVVSLPSALGDLQIRHEQIPEFIDFEGQNPVGDDGVRGMRAMTMPFPVPDEGLLEGVSAGDKVLFTLAVDRASRSYWISRLEPLPEGAELDFGVKDRVGQSP